MQVIVTAMTRMDTREMIHPPMPVDVTALFDVDHKNRYVQFRRLNYSEVKMLWRGLEDIVADCRLRDDGEPDVTFSTVLVQPRKGA